MKIATLLLIAGMMNLWAATTYSQSARISLNLKNVTIEQVLNEIENKSEYYFLFNQKLVDVTRKVDVVADNKSIREVLLGLFADKNVDFLVIDRQIILASKDNLKNADGLYQIKITGKVTDSQTNDPLPGVNVIVEGTSLGVISDLDGNYSISVNSANAVLIFSFVGYNTERIAISGQNQMNIAMNSEIQRLDEVIVVGYGTMQKQNVTTAISKIDPTEVPAAANNSIPQLLFGRAAGLKATQLSAEPGGNIMLSIRGRENNPLIIVDGVVYPNKALEPDNGDIELQGVNRGSLAGLNPSDIESIEVLKDASAAIYGVSAADGVILITTKKGKAGKLKVTYDGSRSIIQNLPYMKPLSAKEYMTYYNTFIEEYHLASYQMEPFGNVPVASVPVPKFSTTDIQNATDQTNWIEEVMRTGSVDNHNLGINGGNEKITYYFSGNYFNQKGTLENSDMKKFTTRLNVSFSLNKFITLNTSINASRNNYTNSGAGWQQGNAGSHAFGVLQAALAYPSYLPVRDAEGNYTIFNMIGNPVSLLDIDDKTESGGLFGTFSADVNIIRKILIAKILYGNNTDNALRNFYIPSTTFWGNSYVSRASVFEDRRQNQTMEGMLSFKKNFGELLDIDAVAGYGQYIDDYKGYGIETTGLLDAVGTDNLGSATGTKTLSSYKGKDKKRSYFMRANFNFLDRYLLSLVYRLDGTDKFFPDNKYAGFPSVSMGWKINKESFMRGLTFVNLLKLRASIGITGRDIGTAAYGIYEADPNIIYFSNGNVIYTPYYQTLINNPDLVWEKTVNKNVGLDFALFKNRISGAFEFFFDRVTNLLSERPANQLSYIPGITENDGARIRKGYEFSLTSYNVQSKYFAWETFFNISNYTYHWDKRYKNADLQPYVKEKDPVNAIYVFETKGILQVGDEVPAYQPDGAKLAGSPIFDDKDGNGILNYNDVVMYNRDPKITIGLGNSFRYKNWDLSVFFYGQFGAKDWNNSLIWSDPNNIRSGNQSGSSEIRNVWTLNNPEGKWPGVSYNESALGLPASVDTRLASKDFIRCRNITFGYTFKPAGSINLFSSIRLYFDIQNLFIFTDYVGADPEVQVGSIKGGGAPYPMARTFSFGVNANF